MFLFTLRHFISEIVIVLSSGACEVPGSTAPYILFGLTLQMLQEFSLLQSLSAEYNDERATMKHYPDGQPTAFNYLAMYMSNWKRAAVVLIILWIVITYLVVSPLRCNDNGNSEDTVHVQERLKTVSSQFESLKYQHNKLLSQIKKSTDLSTLNLKDYDMGTLVFPQGPFEEYENVRRRTYLNTKELWYYMNSALNKVMHEDNKSEKIQTILDNIADRKRSLLSDQQKLREFDGYDDWRKMESANVSDLIQRRLYYLQNPSDCRTARKVICNVNKGCGFGCQLHHIAFCLIFAYAKERTLILRSTGWRYNKNGWDYVFQPLSETCTTTFDDKTYTWPSEPEAKVVSLPFIDSIAMKPKFLPLAIPKDLAHRILRFNGDPASWWIGQILKYILKPRASLQKSINETIATMNIKKPIVGVHIRRTDKVGTEAAFHHIKEYMTHVDSYYDQLELTQPVEERRVYLASDDPSVLEDARKGYPQYKFYGDPQIAKTAATHRRYTPQSLVGLLIDLHVLALCDYIVCTFSSQVCRVAYEMMQGNRVDASDSFYSLDDIFYYGGQNAHHRAAVMPHKAEPDGISFEIGDLIGVAGNHWDGYGRGTNRRTNQLGLFPWYKTTDHLVLYPFPEYKEVPLYSDTRHDL